MSARNCFARLLSMLAGSFAMATALLLTSAPAHAEPALVRFSSLSLEAANTAVSAALAECRKRGALVAVAATDRAGNVLALQRDPLAGMHSADTATRKAWTAISFRTATTALEQATASTSASSGIRHLPGVAMIGGGIPVEAAGSLVGALGVSGAPSGELDEICAKAGLDAIQDDLELGS